MKKIIFSLILMVIGTTSQAQTTGCFASFSTGYCYSSMNCLAASVSSITSAFGSAVGDMCGTIQDKTARLDSCELEKYNCTVTYNNQVNSINALRAEYDSLYSEYSNVYDVYAKQFQTIKKLKKACGKKCKNIRASRVSIKPLEKSPFIEEDN